MVKAKAEITISHIIDISKIIRYYLLQSSTSNKPSKPTTYPPASTWDDTEPTYTDGSTNSLYFVDCTVFSDDTFNYSEVSLSSSYEAAKLAYNKAVNAQNSVNELTTRVTNAETSIQSNKDAIELRATKMEVAESLDGYYKKAETESLIQQESNSITSTVQAIYATKETVTELDPIGKASGNSLRIDDISSIPHEMKVKLSGNDLYPNVDFSETIPKKNYFDGELGQGYIDASGNVVTAVHNVYSINIIPVQSGNAYTLSATLLSTYKDYVLWVTYYTDSQFVGRSNIGSAKTNYTFTIPDDVDGVRFAMNSSNVTPELTSECQLELGSTVTEYEPYMLVPAINVSVYGENLEPVTYYVNEDGTVDGVISIYPTTTLICNNQYVTIDCEYNKNNTLGDSQGIIDRTTETANNAQVTADNTVVRVSLVETTIKQLEDSISMLVSDENGQSLMTQTSTGWTFSTASIEENMSTTQQCLTDLTAELNNTNSVVDKLRQDLENYDNYVHIGEYPSEDGSATEPCIELGERTESDNKVRITNTRILFQVEGNVPVKISGRELESENVRITNEFKQTNPNISGSWVWVVRQNGHYGLTWKEE